MNNFFKNSKENRLKKYQELYYVQNLSWKEIANQLGTYDNKVRRDAISLGIKSRSKSKAQSVAIKEGRHTHPTKGKKRSEETKTKISESQGRVWDELTDEEKEMRSKIGKEAWDKKTEEEKQEFFRKSFEAIQEASRKGSKIERMLSEFLMDEGYLVERHKEHVLQNEKFHIDLYIPKVRLAIEVDGPMHFDPIFGEEKLQKRQAADSQKNGLILQSGMVLVRVKLMKRDSQRYLRQLQNQILDILHSVEEEFPKENERYFEI